MKPTMELSAQELRIGNIVRWKYGEDEYNTVHSIDPEQIDLQIITPFGVRPEDIEPIPLTEEWLLRFVKINWISKDRYGIFYWFNGNKIYIKFVHVLQNTYFCIEQKDLLCRDTVKQNI